MNIGSQWRITPASKRDAASVYEVVYVRGNDVQMRRVRDGHTMTIEPAWFTVRGAMPATAEGAVREVTP